MLQASQEGEGESVSQIVLVCVKTFGCLPVLPASLSFVLSLLQ